MSLNNWISIKREDGKVMSESDLPEDTLQTVVGSDGHYYRPSHLLRGGAERVLGERIVNGNGVTQMKLDLHDGLARANGFPWLGTPMWRILNREDVLVPIIAGPHARRCENGFSSLLKVANTLAMTLERKIKELSRNGATFNKETCPAVFDDAITLDVFTHSPIKLKAKGDVDGTGRLIVMSNGIFYVGSDFPLIVITLGSTPYTMGWIYIKQPRF